MLALTILLAVTVSQAETDGPSPEELKVLRVITDGKGHYVLFDGDAVLHQKPYYGDGKSFFRLRSPGGGGTQGEQWDLTLWEPRSADRASLSMRDANSKFELQCGKKTTALKLLPKEEGDKLLAAAKFVPNPFTRLPERLLRDDSGTYYFVDRLRHEDRRDFLFYKGQRGAMKAVKLKDLVDDSEGLILATKDGSLRLVAGNKGSTKSETKWVSGKASTNLVEVPLDDDRNIHLVYTELGVYEGKRLGSACDDLM